MKKLSYDREHAGCVFTTGVMTYVNDFERLVLPELAKVFDELVEEVVVSDVLLAIHRNTTFYHKPGDYNERGRQKVVQVLHTPIWKQIETYINQDNTGNYRKMITHYKKLLDNFKHQNKVEYTFIPMSIDTENFPQKKKNGKILWYGNITHLKKEQHDILSKLIKFDTLTFSQFNFDGAVYTQKECLDIVAEYEYVFAVGRCALEALSMGCKVIMVGKNYAGALTNGNIIEHWHWSNVNSEYGVVELNKDVLLNDLSLAEVIEDGKMFDMRNFVSDYVREINI